MAAASGLDLLKEDERNCLLTSSLGTGQLILDAYSRGVTQIYLFVGGSATNDAGMGILNALGVRALGNDQFLKPIGSSLLELTGFDETKQIIPAAEISFTVVCDVKNLLFGPQGAAFVYAPQKGADSGSVKLLDQGLRNFAQVVLKQQGIRVDNFEGAGAAGGVAAGIKAFYPTNIRSGIEAIIEMVGLAEAVAAADLVITGEGKFDHQTLEGKVVHGVHHLCSQYQKRMAVICGIVDLDPHQLETLNIWKVSSLVRNDTTMEQAIENAFESVSRRAFELLEEIPSV
jgi:glycerate kinase